MYLFTHSSLYADYFLNSLSQLVDVGLLVQLTAHDLSLNIKKINKILGKDDWTGQWILTQNELLDKSSESL